VILTTRWDSSAKSCLIIFLKKFALKQIFSKIGHFVRICIIRFPKILCCELNDPKNFFSIFCHMGIKNPDFKSIEKFGRSYPLKQLFAINLCQTVIEVGKLPVFYTYWTITFK
jgi:hypothetical protein